MTTEQAAQLASESYRTLDKLTSYLTDRTIYLDARQPRPGRSLTTEQQVRRARAAAYKRQWRRHLKYLRARADARGGNLI
jgi:hypothetical protein